MGFMAGVASGLEGLPRVPECVGGRSLMAQVGVFKGPSTPPNPTPTLRGLEQFAVSMAQSWTKSLKLAFG